MTSTIPTLQSASLHFREGVERIRQWINEANMQFKAGVDAAHEAMNAGATEPFQLIDIY